MSEQEQKAVGISMQQNCTIDDVNAVVDALKTITLPNFSFEINSTIRFSSPQPTPTPDPGQDNPSPEPEPNG